MELCFLPTSSNQITAIRYTHGKVYSRGDLNRALKGSSAVTATKIPATCKRGPHTCDRRQFCSKELYFAELLPHVQNTFLAYHNPQVTCEAVHESRVETFVLDQTRYVARLNASSLLIGTSCESACKYSNLLEIGRCTPIDTSSDNAAGPKYLLELVTLVLRIYMSTVLVHNVLSRCNSQLSFLVLETNPFLFYHCPV